MGRGAAEAIAERQYSAPLSAEPPNAGLASSAQASSPSVERPPTAEAHSPATEANMIGFLKSLRAAIGLYVALRPSER
jgi:hypothetical protein